VFGKRQLLPVLMFFGVCTWTACTHIPHPSREAALAPTGHLASSDSEKACRDLQRDLESLAPSVSPKEAAQVAAVAVEYPPILARDYHVVGPALFHNLMVNVGLRERGLCYQWAEDLLAQLRPLQLRTLELHWAIARPGSYREHNCLVLTGSGQRFDCGIVLDAWRHSGRLYWTPVLTDHYRWEEGQLDAPAAAAASRSASIPPH
jgi:hypothetical protein